MKGGLACHSRRGPGLSAGLSSVPSGSAGGAGGGRAGPGTRGRRGHGAAERATDRRPPYAEGSCAHAGAAWAHAGAAWAAAEPRPPLLSDTPALQGRRSKSHPVRTETWRVCGDRAPRGCLRFRRRSTGRGDGDRAVGLPERTCTTSSRGPGEALALRGTEAPGSTDGQGSEMEWRCSTPESWRDLAGCTRRKCHFEGRRKFQRPARQTGLRDRGVQASIQEGQARRLACRGQPPSAAGTPSPNATSSQPGGGVVRGKARQMLSFRERVRVRRPGGQKCLDGSPGRAREYLRGGIPGHNKALLSAHRI